MKTLVFEKPTKDVDGLLAELRREVGPVITVASDPNRTYVYVADDSPLDPEPEVKSWEDVPELRVESMNRTGEDGVPLAWADGKDLQTLVIQKTTGYGDVLPDSTKVVITTAAKIPLSHRKLKLKDGLASITVGPTHEIGLVSLTVVDSWKKMAAVAVRVRFVVPPTDILGESPPLKAIEEIPVESETPAETDASLEVPESAKAESRSTLWQRLRKILGF